MTIKKPTNPYVNSPLSVPQFMPPQIIDHSIRMDSFDQLLKNRGVKFIHKRAMPCPNMTDLDANNHLPNCPICDSNSFYYYDAREIIGIFSGNNMQKIFEASGVWELGSAAITFPTIYSDGTQADFSIYDRLEMPDHEVRLWEQFSVSTSSLNLRYSITASGVDKMIAVVNGSVVSYIQNTHYNITNGSIVWIEGSQPANNTVVSVVYYANPVYNVVQLMHEQRITQELINGVKTNQRLPQAVLVKRDFLPLA
jgi:hypothetical protein